MVKQGIKRGGVLFIILCCILLVFIMSFNIMAEKNSFNDKTDWNTGIRTITQKSYATGWNESNSLVKWISVPKKSLTKITISVEESRSRDGNAGVLRLTRDDYNEYINTPLWFDRLEILKRGVVLHSRSTNGVSTKNVTLETGYVYRLSTSGRTGYAGGSAEGQIE
ncbi:MAG: hypothetical protein MI740_02625, partial [Halanaerobiales bacterium]|nr:hypothetical protein [Halanaerobiales bacterium]